MVTKLERNAVPDMKTLKKPGPDAAPRILLTLCFHLMLLSGALGQGALLLSNRVAGTLDAPVFNVDGATRLEGQYVSQLAVGTTPDSLELIPGAAPFGTGDGACYTNMSYPEYRSSF